MRRCGEGPSSYAETVADGRLSFSDFPLKLALKFEMLVASGGFPVSDIERRAARCRSQAIDIDANVATADADAAARAEALRGA